MNGVEGVQQPSPNRMGCIVEYVCPVIKNITAQLIGLCVLIVNGRKAMKITMLVIELCVLIVDGR